MIPTFARVPAAKGANVRIGPLAYPIKGTDAALGGIDNEKAGVPAMAGRNVARQNDEGELP